MLVVVMMLMMTMMHHADNDDGDNDKSKIEQCQFACTYDMVAAKIRWLIEFVNAKNKTEDGGEH